MLAGAHDEAHVVLDEEDRDAALLDLVDEVEELVGLLLVHAAGRLVEDEELRLGGEGASDLESPLVAVGQVLGEIAGAVEEADEAELKRARVTAARSSRTSQGGRSMAPRSPERVRQCRPASAFSSEESCWKSRMFWKVRATPRATIRWVGSRSRERPSKSIPDPDPGGSCR